MAQLKLTQIRKRYEGKEVLHGLDLGIEDGQFVVIVGPSGCGKSTLLRMIAGLEDISEGEIAINGEVVNDIEPADRGCAMVFQNYALYPHMSVRQNMDYPLKIARLSKEEREKRVLEAARILDLTDYLERRPGQLSGGQRQRVAMGRAIVRDPSIFLFDEPLSNLDAKLRVQMRIEIRRLHKRLKATSIFVTHDQVEAMTLADLLVVMNGGHIEQVGTPAQVYRKPASTFVAGFMGAPAMNLLDATILRNGQIGLDKIEGTTIPGLQTGLAEGTGITLGIRPEDVTLAAPGAPGLAARIDLIEELGGSQIAYCTLGSVEVAVVLPRDLDVKEGGALTLNLRPGALHMFDRASGKRVEAAAPASPARARETVAAE